MTLMSSIIKNLNESAEVKKTFGDTPEEGKEIRLVKGKKVSVPKTKNTSKSFKSIKLDNRNKQAADVFVSDTDKVLDQQADKKTGTGKGVLPKGKAKIYTDKVEKPFGETITESEEDELETKFKCEIGLDGDAFSGEDENTSIRHLSQELGSIFTGIKNKIDRGDSDGSVLDSNGNKVGKWSITKSLREGLSSLENAVHTSRSDIDMKNVVVEPSEKGGWYVYENREKAKRGNRLFTLAPGVLSSEDAHEAGIVFVPEDGE